MSPTKYSSAVARQTHGAPFAVAIIGAGPIGLGIAIELARARLSVVVLEGRPPPGDGLGRPQLLVARPADLARLHRLGVDIGDPAVVSPLARLREGDASRERAMTINVEPLTTVPAEVRDPWELAAQRPQALVPIVRLQAALAEIAAGCGVELAFGVRATRVRRHARFASIDLDVGPPVRAHFVVIATGASRSLADDHGVFRLEERCPPRALIGGVFDKTASDGQWHRFEHALGGAMGDVRCTVLETTTESNAGTALIAEAPRSAAGLLPRCFAEVADAHGLTGAMLTPARVFSTQVAAAQARYLARDNRAPLVIAGDAAQTGHVFSGLTCFVNLWAALELTGALARASAIDAIAEARVSDPALLGALERYELASDRATEVLTRSSRHHYRVGAWAAARAAA